MKIVEQQITLEELKKMSEKMYGKLVKAVIDIEKDILIVDAEMHSDLEEVLLEQGSAQENLWGINLHPLKDANWIEFDSMINLRPSYGNESRSINDVDIQKKIIDLVNKRIVR